MKALAALVGLYTKLDAHLDAELSGSPSDAKTQRLEAQRGLNDKAYFLLFWGQLETEIDAACRQAIRARRDHAEWEVRRGWDLYNPDDRRLSGLTFEDRLSLVLDRTCPPWARAMGYYALRNQIAHGRSSSDGIEMTAVVADFYVIQAALIR